MFNDVQPGQRRPGTHTDNPNGNRLPATPPRAAALPYPIGIDHSSFIRRAGPSKTIYGKAGV